MVGSHFQQKQVKHRIVVSELWQNGLPSWTRTWWWWRWTQPNLFTSLPSSTLLQSLQKAISVHTLLIYIWISHHNFYSLFLPSSIHSLSNTCVWKFKPYPSHPFKPKIAIFQKPSSGFPLFFRVSLLKPQSQLAFVFSRKFTSTFSVFFYFLDEYIDFFWSVNESTQTG